MNSDTSRVLYIHHSATFGGSAKSLIEMLTALESSKFESVVICPKGTSSTAFEDAGINTITTRGISILDNTRMGAYRGVRWLLILRELALLPGTVYLLAKTIRQNHCKVIHINDGVCVIAGVVASLMNIPVVWHMRSVMSTKYTLRKRLWDAIVNHCASVVMPIDETVSRSLTGIRKPDRVIVHNIVNVTDINKRKTSRRHLERYGISEDNFVFAIMGVLLPVKGIYDFIYAAIECHKHYPKSRFLVIGSNVGGPGLYKGILGKCLAYIGLLQNHEHKLVEFIKEHRLGDSVVLPGFVMETDEIYTEIDVLCFPSYLESIGRPVYEAAVHGKPSIIALSDSSFVDQKVTNNSLVVPPGRPHALAAAMLECIEHPKRLKDMGGRMRHVAMTRHGRKENIRLVEDAYTMVLSG